MQILLWILSLIMHELIPIMQVGLLLLAGLVVVVGLQLDILHVFIPGVDRDVDVGLLPVFVGVHVHLWVLILEDPGMELNA